MWQKFWQHFLVDTTVLKRTQERIQQLIDEYTPQRLIEIGPGQWALTQYLLKLHGNHLLTAIETDERLKKYLTQWQFKDLDILRGDVLQQPIQQCWESYLVVGNLPYYITSPIFLKLFWENTKNSMKSACFGGVFLIQREVARKVDSLSSKKSYLWRCMQYTYDVQYEFTVWPECFAPPPKVNSAVISVTRREWAQRSFSYARMIAFLDIVSQYTRKSLGKIFTMRKEDLVQMSCRLPEHLRMKRVEALSWEEMGEVLTYM